MKNICAILGLSVSGIASAGVEQLPLPPASTLGHSCAAAVTQVATYMSSIESGIVTAELLATTKCAGSGRGGGYRTIFKSYWTIQWDFTGHYTLFPYDGESLVPGNVVSDALGNTAYTTNSTLPPYQPVPYLNVVQAP